MNPNALRLHAVALAITALALEATAQTAPATPASGATDASVQTITISASRRLSSVAEVPGSVQSISGEQLEAETNISREAIDGLVKLVPGLSTASESGFDLGRGPALRGKSSTVLINGVPVNALLRTSGYSIGLVDSFALDRTEVSRGATAAFGFGAPGGVISLSTRRGETTDREFVFRSSLGYNPEGGSDSATGKLYLGVGQKQDWGDYYVGLALTHEGAKYEPDGRYTQSEVTNNVALDSTVGFKLGADSRLQLSMNYFKREFEKDYVIWGSAAIYCVGNNFTTCPVYGGVPEGAMFTAFQNNSGLAPSQFQENILGMVRLTSKVFGQDLDLAVYGMRNSIRYVQAISSFSDPPVYTQELNEMDNDRFGLRSSLTSRLNLGTASPMELTYGLDWQVDKLFRPYYIGPRTSSGPLPEDRPLSPPIQLQSTALFLQVKQQLGDWLLSAGARREQYKPKSDGYTVTDARARTYVWPAGDIPDFNSNVYNLGVIYKLSNSSEMYASMSEGVEIAELGRELRGLAAVGRPADLSRLLADPVINTQTELGYRARSRSLSYSVAAFHIDSPLAGGLNCTVVGIPCQPIRTPEKAWGWELTADWRGGSSWNVGGNYTWMNGKTQNTTTGIWSRASHLTAPPPRLTIYGGWRPMAGLKTTLSMTKVFDTDRFAEAPYTALGLPAGVESNVKGYEKVDLSVAMEVGPGTLSFSVENLLNETYISPQLQVNRTFRAPFYAEGRRTNVGYSVNF
jgi:iron complex outermembrane receptor protein